MRWFLVFFLSTAGIITVGVCIVTLFVRSRVQRRHRVDPKVSSPAPLTWLADPRAPARLHRRLVKVGGAASSIADEHRVTRRLRKNPEPSTVVALADQLRDEARRLDHELTRVALLAPDARRRGMASLGSIVADLERATAQLVGVSADVQTDPVLPTDDQTMLDITGQIERLAEAHAALRALDADAGLVVPPTVTSPAPRQTRS